MALRYRILSVPDNVEFVVETTNELGPSGRPLTYAAYIDPSDANGIRLKSPMEVISTDSKYGEPCVHAGLWYLANPIYSKRQGLPTFGANEWSKYFGGHMLLKGKHGGIIPCSVKMRVEGNWFHEMKHSMGLKAPMVIDEISFTTLQGTKGNYTTHNLRPYNKGIGCCDWVEFVAFMTCQLRDESVLALLSTLEGLGLRPDLADGLNNVCFNSEHEFKTISQKEI